MCSILSILLHGSADHTRIHTHTHTHLWVVDTWIFFPSSFFSKASILNGWSCLGRFKKEKNTHRVTFWSWRAVGGAGGMFIWRGLQQMDVGVFFVADCCSRQSIEHFLLWLYWDTFTLFFFLGTTKLTLWLPEVQWAPPPPSSFFLSRAGNGREGGGSMLCGCAPFSTMDRCHWKPSSSFPQCSEMRRTFTLELVHVMCLAAGSF